MDVEIQNKTVRLIHAADVVRFSFILNNSISYLDPSISENATNRCIASENGYRLKDQILKHSNEYIGTKEKCRKIFSPHRSILYTLHLDLSKRKENSLKQDSYPCMDSRVPHIAKLEVPSEFYVDTLIKFIEKAVQVTVEKLGLLRLILKIPQLKKRVTYVADSFIDCFYPKITNFELLECFIKNFDVTYWIYRNESAEILEFLLYHMRNFGKDLREDFITIPELIYECIFNEFFSNIGAILKYINSPGISVLDRDSYIYEIPSLGPFDTDEVITKSKKWVNPERIRLILMALFIFDKRNRNPQRNEDASEALRLLWNCSTQAYMTFQDVERAFGGTHSHEVLVNMYEFYCCCIGEDHSCIETRPLTHLCRAAIRKRLYQNKIWIPKGVRLLPLPKSLQSFLNLEKQLVTPL